MIRDHLIRLWFAEKRERVIRTPEEALWRDRWIETFLRPAP